MGRLIFIGLGLTKDHITLGAIERARECDVLFAEEYTSRNIGGGLEILASKTGKEISVLSREEVESGDVILKRARSQTVGFVVAGDPLAATTHIEIRNRARDMGVETEVVYGVSILSAAPGAFGLMHYKFGRTTTLPYPEGGYLPTSPLEVIYENMKRGLHTLVLLDIRADEGRYMTASEGLRVLLEMEKKLAGGPNRITPDTVVCAGARIGALPGTDAMPERAVAGRLKDVISVDLGPPLHVLVVPGKLHFVEEESLRQIWVGQV